MEKKAARVVTESDAARRFNGIFQRRPRPQYRRRSKKKEKRKKNFI
jgi:hypothetical protein